MKPLPFLGIDLGTTNTVIAVAYKDRADLIGSHIVKILQRDRHATISFSLIEYLPSVLFFDQNGEIIVGDYAKYMRSSQPERVIFNSKRFMGTSAEWAIDNRIINARTAASEILRVCKDAILRKLRIDSIRDVPIVITHPASFNLTSRQIRKTPQLTQVLTRKNYTFA